MVKIAIIGWYGTETIGDRAILAGLFRILGKVYSDFEIMLGAIYPTVTERTLMEDKEFYDLCTGRPLNISLFDSSKVSELNDAIKRADIVAVGGGPLMDTDPIYMLEYAFKRAVRKKKKTAILGCGMGPLGGENYIKSAVSIVDHSDLAIFRDSKSTDIYHELSGNKKECYSSIDPALFAADVFNGECAGPRDTSQVTVNFREIIDDVFSGVSSAEIQNTIIDLVRDISAHDDKTVRLIPMHTFTVGGDDRFILNRIARKAACSNVTVQNVPLSLTQTMSAYYNSDYCVGMRFHAALLQTVLNGKNFIVDYTDPSKGKIVNLMEQLGMKEAYGNRYYSIYDSSGEHKGIDYDSIHNRFEIPPGIVSGFEKIYTENISKLLDNG